MNSQPLMPSASLSLVTTAPPLPSLNDGVLRGGQDPEREPRLVESLLREWFQIGELTIDQLQGYLAAAAQQ